MIRPVEATASLSWQEAFFRRIREELQAVTPCLAQMQNHFGATAERRELVRLCMQIAKDHGHDI